MHKISTPGHDDPQSGAVLAEAIVAFFLFVLWGSALFIVLAQIWKSSHQFILEFEHIQGIMKTL